MTHYMVSSPEMYKVIPILDDGTGPTEYFCCVCFVDAPNKRIAKSLSLKDVLMKDWVDEQRSNLANPFSGLKVVECKCEHGKCWCDNCIKQFGECEKCFNDDSEIESK